MLNNIALQNVVISNPGTRYAPNKTITAFITSENNPSVSIFIGRAKISMIGFMNRFNVPSTIEVIIAVVRDSKCTPLSILPVIKIATVLIINLSNKFFIYVYARVLEKDCQFWPVVDSIYL